MPKIKEKESALHDWVHELTFQQQALLMTGMRGPDGSNKYDAAKVIVRFLRGAICKPAGDWDGKNNNDFMWGDYSVFNTWRLGFFDDPDGYPHHFIMHLVHCAEVIGYKHPNEAVRDNFEEFYRTACRAFHMKAETEAEMDRRLNDFGVPISSPQPEPSEEETLGQILKEARTAKRISIKNVLEATGVSNEYLRKLEGDELKSPSASVLWKLAEYYGIDLKPLAIKAGIIIKAPSAQPSENDDSEKEKYFDFQGWANDNAESDAEDDVTLWMNGAKAAYNYVIKKPPSPPPVKPDKETELIDLLKKREISVARVAEQFPYWEGSRDTFRWLIKHLKGQPDDNFPDDRLPEIETFVKPEKEEEDITICENCGSRWNISKGDCPGCGGRVDRVLSPKFASPAIQQEAIRNDNPPYAIREDGPASAVLADALADMYVGFNITMLGEQEGRFRRLFDQLVKGLRYVDRHFYRSIQQEDGEPPEELKNYLDDKMRPFHNRLSYRAGALDVYHKMQEELQDVSDCLGSEILGYKAVVKDQNLQLSALRQEAADYRKAIESSIRNYYDRRLAFDGLKNVLAKYPQKPNNE